VAASYCSATLAEIPPRSLTVIPWSFAHARMSALRSRLDAVRRGLACRVGVYGLKDEGLSSPRSHTTCSGTALAGHQRGSPCGFSQKDRAGRGPVVSDHLRCLDPRSVPPRPGAQPHRPHRQPGADTRVLWGCFLDLVNALACIGTAMALFPVVRRQNEAFALGFVTSRMLEAAIIVIGVVSLLAVVTLRQDLAGAPGTDTASLLTTGRALVAVRD
jgi:Domain of unknown function (DUF4386)